MTIQMTQRPSDTVFQASFSDFRLVKGRKVCQLVFEIPIEASSHALEVMGGVPNPGMEAWAAIARIDRKPKLASGEIWRASADCAMLCQDKRFQEFMQVPNERLCAAAVRNRLEVSSRSAIDRDQAVAQKWSLMKVEYLEWLEGAK